MCRPAIAERAAYRARGYTFVELLLVLVIISVAGSFAIPAYQDYVMRARMAEAFALAAGPRDAVGAYFAHRGSFPADNAAAGLPPPGDLIGRYVTRTEVEDGAIHLHLRLIGSYATEGERVLSFRPAVIESDAPANAITWLCGYVQPLEAQSAAGVDRTTVQRRILTPACL